MSSLAQQIAEKLHQSTLSAAEKEAVIGMLPRLSLKKINRLMKILDRDKCMQDQLWTKAEGKNQRLLLKFELELEKELKVLHQSHGTGPTGKN